MGNKTKERFGGSLKLPNLNSLEVGKSGSRIHKNDELFKLPEVHLLNNNEDKNKFKKHFELENAEELEINEEHKEAIEKYESLMSIFKNKKIDSNDLLGIYRDEIKKMNLYNIEDIELSIKNGQLDLSKYDTFTMNKLLKEIEKKNDQKKLNEYEIETIEDFFELVTSGELDVSKYDSKELDKFIDNLID